MYTRDLASLHTDTHTHTLAREQETFYCIASLHPYLIHFLFSCFLHLYHYYCYDNHCHNYHRHHLIIEMVIDIINIVTNHYSIYQD